MKTYLKIATLFVIVSLFSVGCKKHDCQQPKSDLVDAIITGNDLRACACCGGLMITFTTNPTPYAGKFYDIDQMPANTGINENSTFPVNVRVKYNTTTSCGDHVNILILEKR